MPAKPPRKPNPPTKLGRALFTMPLDAASTPAEAEQRQRNRTRRRRGNVCVCQPWPCTPRTGCDPACRPCGKWGPFYSREDVRFLDGDVAAGGDHEQEAS